MKKKPVLVVMAAGMGSRYGGLKQIDPVGPSGEVILDYSLYDAYRAGFETAVIIIKEAIREDFMATVGKRLERCPMEIRYACQELEKLPEGFSIPEGRIKPWGTSHAVLCARDQIGDAPFGVLNSDDYYGKAAFRELYDYLSQPRGPGEYCMVGYRLGNTVSDSGSVARGVCEVGPDGRLTVINERTRIEKYPGGIHFTTDGGASWQDLPPEQPVSMNMWGFAPGFLQELERRFPNFLNSLTPADAGKREFLLPVTVAHLLAEDRITVQVLPSQDKWYGVTYPADKPQVVAALRELTQAGLYPKTGLWSK